MKYRRYWKNDRLGTALKSKKREKRIFNVVILGRWEGSDWSTWPKLVKNYCRRGKEKGTNQTSFAQLKKGHRRYLPSPSPSGMFQPLWTMPPGEWLLHLRGHILKLDFMSIRSHKLNSLNILLEIKFDVSNILKPVLGRYPIVHFHNSLIGTSLRIGRIRIWWVPYRLCYVFQ